MSHESDGPVPEGDPVPTGDLTVSPRRGLVPVPDAPER